MLIYLLAVPFLLFAGFGVVIFFLATAYLLSREYFELAAMRYRPPAEARAMRKANQSTVFLAGLMIAAFVSIPIVNLATPLFGMALMVHMHKRLSRPHDRAADSRRNVSDARQFRLPHAEEAHGVRRLEARPHVRCARPSFETPPLARGLAAAMRPGLLQRQRGHRHLDGAVGLGDDAQRLGIELDPDEAQRGDRRIDAHAVGGP